MNESQTQFKESISNYVLKLLEGVGKKGFPFQINWSTITAIYPQNQITHNKISVFPLKFTNKNND